MRNDDVVYPVRAGSDYVYLTGDQTAGGVLCLDPVSASGRRAVPRRPCRDAPGTEFYSDAARGELWVGPQPSLEAREQALGLVCRPRGGARRPPGRARRGRSSAGPPNPRSTRSRNRIGGRAGAPADRPGLRAAVDQGRVGARRAAARDRGDDRRVRRRAHAAAGPLVGQRARGRDRVRCLARGARAPDRATT